MTDIRKDDFSSEANNNTVLERFHTSNLIEVLTSSEHKYIDNKLAHLAELSQTQCVAITRGKGQLNGGFPYYPHRTHSRFDHLYGSAILANEYALYLKLNDRVRILVVVATFLHDIGHGPFSHAFENVFRKKYNVEKSHDTIRKDIIKLVENEISKINVHPIITIQEIYDIWDKNSFDLYQISQGPIGADRLHFLTCDSDVLKINSRTYDRDLIIKNAKKCQYKGNSVVAHHVNTLDDIINMLKFRQHMYNNWYCSVYAMASNAVIEYLLETSFEKADLLNMINTPEIFVKYDDNKMLEDLYETGDDKIKLVIEKLTDFHNQELPALYRKTESTDFAEYESRKLQARKANESAKTIYDLILFAETISFGIDLSDIYITCDNVTCVDMESYLRENDSELYDVVKKYKKVKYLYEFVYNAPAVVS